MYCFSNRNVRTGPACFPNRSQTFVVRNGVLNNERLDSVRMGQGHAKTHGAAVILHVKRVAREPKSFGEVIHGFGDVIERVREFFRVWPVTVSEEEGSPCSRRSV